jgi:adenylylsulfate kinase-like enzyme
LFGVFERERLFAALDAQRRHPAVWIAGPPGAGKTTLVASYLQARAARPLVPGGQRRCRPGLVLLLPRAGRAAVARATTRAASPAQSGYCACSLAALAMRAAASISLLM